MLVGVLLGAAVVFLFSGLAINAVGRAAGAVVFEVRRQFREIPGIMEGTGRPEYGKVVDIVTQDSLRELVTPGVLAVLAPIAVGFGLGVAALAGFLAGAIGTGTLMAVFLANSGGAWDNAKKLVEDGHHGGKGSSAHEATIIGDTVGDPFKDTAGPAINPLIKVMNLVSLLIASAVVSMSVGDDQNDAAAHRDRAGRGRDHRDRGDRASPSVVRPSSVTRPRPRRRPRPSSARRLRRTGLPTGQFPHPRVRGLPGRHFHARNAATVATDTVQGWCRRTASDSPACCARRWPLPASPTRPSPTCWVRRPTRRSRATRPSPACAPPPAGTPAETLTRLWLLQAPVPGSSGRRGPARPARPALRGRHARASPPGRCAPGSTYAPTPRTTSTCGWPATSLPASTAGRCGSSPTTSWGSAPRRPPLALLTVRDRVGSALDLGTGCGVQALHLAGHADQVVATDVNERALRLTRFNAALNGVEIDARAGSIFEPVRGGAASTWW